MWQTSHNYDAEIYVSTRHAAIGPLPIRKILQIGVANRQPQEYHCIIAFH